jgi:hypothetical protein
VIDRLNDGLIADVKTESKQPYDNQNLGDKSDLGPSNKILPEINTAVAWL